MERRFAALALISLVHGAGAQSIMYSPVAASSPDLVVSMAATDFVRLLDHSGLTPDFTSGVTPWGAYNNLDLCASLHVPGAGDLEFWGLVQADLGHVILDMGFEGTWDRMAIYNEETTGLGTEPTTLSFGPTANGPWEDLCRPTLTDNPPSTSYGPDVLSFPPVTTRYFRVTGAGSTFILQGQYAFAVAEVFVGTADGGGPTGTCVQPCGPTSIGSQHEAVVNAMQVTVDPSFGTVSINSGRTLRSVACYNALGQLMAARTGAGTLDISGWMDGIYVVHALTTDGAQSQTFLKAAWP
ncbi:MAG: T9SS type A sorting domain-containing protein [Flavobacteriales bacterium]